MIRNTGSKYSIITADTLVHLVHLNPSGSFSFLLFMRAPCGLLVRYAVRMSRLPSAY